MSDRPRTDSCHREPDTSPPVVAVAAGFEPGFCGDWHANPKAQLIYPGRGVMTLHTRAGVWIVPPERGMWLPAGAAHRVETPRGLEMYSVYCEGSILGRLPRASGVVAVSSLLRELILTLEAGRSREPSGRRGRLASVFADEVALMPHPALSAPPLRSDLLRAIESALGRDPADARSLEDWAAELRVSSRTLARAFRREAHMSFLAYRDEVRLAAALARLAGGQSVTSTAHAVGFHSVSYFIARFKRATGTMPRKYFAARS